MKHIASITRMTRKIATIGLAGLVLASLANTAASAQAWAARHGMTSAQYQSEFNKYTGQGYRLTDVSSYLVNGKPYYAAIWENTGGSAWVARHGMSGGTYQSEFNKFTSQGYAPQMVDGMSLGNKPRFAAQWAKTGGAWVARHGLTSAQYQAEFNKWTGQGYRLVDVSGYGANGKAYYAAIWKKQGGGAWVARHGMTAAKYQSEFNKLTAQGFKPLHVDGYNVAGTPYFAAIWVKSGGAWVARHGLTSAQYQAEFNKWTSKGYKLHDISGYGSSGGARYAAIWYK